MYRKNTCKTSTEPSDPVPAFPFTFRINVLKCSCAPSPQSLTRSFIKTESRSTSATATFQRRRFEAARCQGLSSRASTQALWHQHEQTPEELDVW
ncbi:hypothetical protein BC834DRAFT_875686 [Gloeopeniophorella convolvens]|nr:hypothetical protein BC834DRAFT_875686 [Gloeopeniophorella convolvens]